MMSKGGETFLPIEPVYRIHDGIVHVAATERVRVGDDDTASCMAAFVQPFEFEIARSKRHSFFHS